MVLNGSLGTDEIWSTSFQFGGGGFNLVDSQEGLDTWSGALGIALDGLTTNVLQVLLGSDNTIDSVDVQYYEASNQLALQSSSSVSAVVGASSNSCPRQTAVVLSLRTGLPGGSRRGRCYWPAIGADIGANGRLASGNTPLEIAQDFAAMVSGIAATAPSPFDAQYGVYSVALDTVTPVTLIQCGDVPDTQRRRRDGMIEQYSATAYPPA